MKIITLNTWGGFAGKEKLLGFFEKHKNDVDIFCLQEIWSAPYKHLEGTNAGGVELQNDKIMTYGKQDISALLSGHDAYFRPHHAENYGLLMLVKKNLKVIEEGEIFVYREKGFVDKTEVGNHARNIQYVTLETKNGLLTVVNFHGLWNGQGKGDSEDRLKQSDNIINFFKNISNPIIFCGDFNLRPDTKSIKKFEDFGLRNLVTEYGVTSTRTSLYKKSSERFADYIFVSKEVKANDFKVLPDEVFDHLPLFLDCN